MRTVAALFVAEHGPYTEWWLDGVDPWPEIRDARLYNEAHPVVAHPPCNRFSLMATVHGRRNGKDGGCFASALDSVRRCGGVLEHPAYTLAWRMFGLKKPGPAGWSDADEFGGRTARVEQGHYGHEMGKPTWLYAVGVDPPPELRWGASGKPNDVQNMSSRGHGRMASVRRERTPPAFRDVLLAMARSVRMPAG